MRLLAMSLLAGCASSSFEAILDIDRLAAGKVQGVWLEKADGERLLVAYEPSPEYFRFVEKRVVVQGETYRPDPHTAHIGATHIRIQSIELAPGETAGDERLPPPRLVRSKAELAPGRWIEVQGSLRSAEKHADDDWCDAILVLADGTELVAQMYVTEMESKWQPLIGQRVTALGKLVLTERYELIGPAICAGEVRGCGMR